MLFGLGRDLDEVFLLQSVWIVSLELLDLIALASIIHLGEVVEVEGVEQFVVRLLACVLRPDITIEQRLLCVEFHRFLPQVLNRRVPSLLDVLLIFVCKHVENFHLSSRSALLPEILDVVFDRLSTSFLVREKIFDDAALFLVLELSELRQIQFVKQALVLVGVVEVVVLRRRVVSVFQDQLLCICGLEGMRLEVPQKAFGASCQGLHILATGKLALPALQGDHLEGQNDVLAHVTVDDVVHRRDEHG